MILHAEKLTGSSSSGTFSVNTSTSTMGMCHQVICKPATGTTTYDIKITNGDSLIVYERTSETGELSELTELPMRGAHTITISNATADEAFTVELIYVQQY